MLTEIVDTVYQTSQSGVLENIKETVVTTYQTANTQQKIGGAVSLAFGIGVAIGLPLYLRHKTRSRSEDMLTNRQKEAKQSR